ncbi:hypothetical protein NDU88_003028 [Pleurodeles waltl]|uniref:Uncharacterized protein n=1 Tax=Pleurodeles waltl TaxID=8319 RepID=A0AAV7W4U7_PLEWA|nr:hypothetical protein NDU88_003028 [Pleurodeles waltl]
MIAAGAKYQWKQQAKRDGTPGTHHVNLCSRRRVSGRLSNEEACGRMADESAPTDGREIMFMDGCPSDSGYPNLLWLLAPVRNARTGAENRYNDARGRTRRIIERTFGF